MTEPPTVPTPVPLLSVSGPYRAHFPWLAGGDAHTIATDASMAISDETVAAWAAVRGDGSARFGWYTAARTNTMLAELEAIRWGLHRAPDQEPIRLITDANDAVRLAGNLLAGRGTLKRMTIVHPELLASTEKALRRHPVVFDLRKKAIRGRKRSRPGLHGVADRLAWTALQFALHGIAVDDPAAQRWLRSDQFHFSERGVFSSRRENLRRAWRRSSYPGHHLQ